MKQRLEAWLEQALPGLGWRPFWLTVVSAYALVLYYHHGARSEAPRWFLDASVSLTGLPIDGFHRHGWSHMSAVVLLMVIPLALSRWSEGWTARDLGLGIRGTQREFVLVVVLWLLFIPVIGYFSGTESFARTYPRLRAAETNMGIFFAYQAYYLVKWTAWEFFFRGFMLFGFKADFGNRAVLISTLPFVLMHVGKPELEMVGSLAAGFILCAIALRSRSIWPGVFIHSMVATTMDFFASTWWH